MSGLEWVPFLGPIMRVIDEIRGRPSLRITLERDVKIDARMPPVSRNFIWGGNRLKTYYLLEVQNVSTRPFRFMRAKVVAPKLEYPRWLTKGNDGMELAPREPIHFLLDAEEVGDLTGAPLTIESLGWQKTYQL